MKLDIQVIYHDQDITVIHKPAGVVTNRAKSVRGETIQDWMENFLKDKPWPKDWQKLVPADFNQEYGTPETIFEDRVGMVHRLDKETSGILILANHPGSLVNLLSQFRLRQVAKTYICLAHNKFLVPADTINLPLGRDNRDRKKFAAKADGRAAVTEYRVKKFFAHLDVDQVIQNLKQKYPQEDRLPAKFRNFRRNAKIYQGFSLVECLPKTGRTHQIRVHMKALGHPLVGDELYVGKKRVNLDLAWCPRQFLHAQSLEITHPRSKEVATYVAQLPTDLASVLKLLSED